MQNYLKKIQSLSFNNPANLHNYSKTRSLICKTPHFRKKGFERTFNPNNTSLRNIYLYKEKRLLPRGTLRTIRIHDWLKSLPFAVIG